MAAKRRSEATSKRGTRQAGGTAGGSSSGGGKGRGNVTADDVKQCVTSKLPGKHTIKVVDLSKGSPEQVLDVAKALLKQRKVRFVILNAPFKVRDPQPVS
jgi:hypothetical protein